MKNVRFKSKRFEMDGHTFYSVRERDRYAELKALEQSCAISSLEVGPRYEIIPNMRTKDGKRVTGAWFTPSFRYKEAGKVVVEDVRTILSTSDYLLRTKLMLKVHGIEVKGV